MKPKPFKSALAWTLFSILVLVSCDRSQLPDSHRQAWVVLVDLSGTAVDDRPHYVQELKLFIQEMTNRKPNTVVHIVGFSGFAKPLAGAQAQRMIAQMEEVTKAISNWPLDNYTNLSAAFLTAYELLRTTQVEKRMMWVLSDGIPDPKNKYRTRPECVVPIQPDFPFAQLQELGVQIHWDDCSEYQFSLWQRAFEANNIPAMIHLRGYAEQAASRLRGFSQSDAESF